MEAIIEQLRALRPYLQRYRKPILAGIVSMLLAIGFSRVAPWFMKLAIDALREGMPMSHVVRYIGVMVGATLLGGLFLYLQRWLLIGTSRKIEYDLRTDFYAHVQRLDLAFFGRKQTGDLMAHFTNDLNAVRDVCGPGIMYFTQMTTLLAASITLMLILDARLTLVAFLPFPLITVYTYFFGKRMYTYSRAVQDQFGVISSRAQEDLGGMRVIRAYAQEESAQRRFHGLGHDYLLANMRVAKLRGSFFAVTTALTGVGLAIALWIGGRQVMNGDITLGSLVAFTAYLAEMTWPVIAVGWVIGMFQRGASAMSRLSGVLTVSPTIVSGADESTPRPRVAFDDVTFHYPGSDTPALANVSFQLDAGQTLGIVGRTGSGKSTLLKLVLRFYDPDSGRVVVDDVDLRDRDLETVRRAIGYAPQDSFLFSRSLSDNIAYGMPDADAARVRDASTRARFHSDVTGFPDAYDTLVGERGVTLSGGQRQRASLARALILDPEILLLDDTLSSVDAETEEEILVELRTITSERTSIIVSHRISAVERADWILVLDRGHVIEEGRHADLVKGGGLYARLHERQQLAAEIERRA